MPGVKERLVNAFSHLRVCGRVEGSQTKSRCSQCETNQVSDNLILSSAGYYVFVNGGIAHQLARTVSFQN